MRESLLRQPVCRSLASVAIGAGFVGMAVSFVFMASSNFMDITAGTSGFVAGAILIGSGLMSLALLGRQSQPVEATRAD